ncbi:MAG: Rieske (2Fe-2S) protein [Halioglobus sp.]|nr:Rieske (2Fe-2S) protein [Halioglobus sp.]
MQITPEARAFNTRPNTVDHDRVGSLQYLGNYERRLPVNMERMLENALDWEHLPHMHASSFADIACIDSGGWGWRAVARPTGEQAQEQVLELLVDRERNYWATTILTGAIAGIEIHTQAEAVSDSAVDIDVRFLSAQPLAQELAELFLSGLQQQYAVLYDEDVALMSGRQAALDDRERWRTAQATRVLVGDVAALRATGIATAECGGGRFCVRWSGSDWIVHSAVCTHLLGPLDGELNTDGSVTCPWHGFHFDVVTGENLDGGCRALAQAPLVEEEAGKLYLVPRL